MGASSRSAAGFRGLSELEACASERVDAPTWSYVQGGAGEEHTLRWNREAFDAWTLRPRALVDVSNVDLTSSLLGSSVGAPFFPAPTAYQATLHPDGELATARAAAESRLLGAFSTLSSRSLEEIAAAGGAAPRWFQLYLQPTEAASLRLVERAERAGFSAIVLTVDVPVFGMRDRQAREGFALEAPVPLGNGPDVAPPPRLRSLVAGRLGLPPPADATWSLLDRLAERTQLPIVVKGILTVEDARAAVARGAAGIIVSNHGGRQLDRVAAPLAVLPSVVDAVGSSVEVYIDGGFRRGSEILIALALGARAVGLGRPVLWALACGGEAGVRELFNLLQMELAAAMAMTGCRSLSEVSRGILAPHG